MADETFDPTPALGKVSFTCPHRNCRALAHQRWSSVWVDELTEDRNPHLVSEGILERIENDEDIDDGRKRDLLEHFERVIKGHFFIYTTEWRNIKHQLSNASISRCQACRQVTLWKYDRILWPATKAEIAPHADMPDDIIVDFEEAAEIVDASPRGACALLRLCVQKLCIHLGFPGKNLNEDIKQMVSRGLSVEVQQAFDIVRVTGGNAVHPLEMDLRDDRPAALTLFKLVNNIVDRLIAEPKRMTELFSALPPGAQAAIAKRDAPKLLK